MPDCQICCKISEYSLVKMLKLYLLYFFIFIYIFFPLITHRYSWHNAPSISHLYNTWHGSLHWWLAIKIAFAAYIIKMVYVHDTHTHTYTETTYAYLVTHICSDLSACSRLWLLQMLVRSSYDQIVPLCHWGKCLPVRLGSLQLAWAGFS